MLFFDLMTEFQFGPHTLTVTGISGKGFDDPDRLITAKCIETCCSNDMAVHITMPAGELTELTRLYNEKLGTAKMRREISKIMKAHRERDAERVRKPVPIDEQSESPLAYGYRAKKTGL